MDNKQHRVRLDEPVTYRIRVQDRLDASWTSWFDGLTISISDEGQEPPSTTLTGLIKDQAELHTLLARIRDLGLPLLLVEAIFVPAVNE